MKIYQKKLSIFLIMSGFLVLQYSTVFSQSQTTDSILQNERFVRSFKTKYETYYSLPNEALTLELSDVLEDLLVSGSHASRTGLDYKISRVEKLLYKKMRTGLCGTDYKTRSSHEKTIYSIIYSLVDFSNSEGLELTDAQYGTLVGILFCIVNQTSQHDFCNGTSFFQLAE